MVEVKITNPPALKLQDLLQTVTKYNPKADLELIEKAYNFTNEAHAGQTRATGEPYIQHPLHVAKTIAELRLGTTAIVAALLHDVREDTSPEFSQQIAPRFGEAVNFIVQSVTKLTKVRRLREHHSNVEDLRNIFLAMNRDIRVVIIKLADRLHNLKTLYGLPGQKQKRIAKQTLDIYAPLADRLGIGNIKGQLEDLAFKYLMPKEAEWVQSQVKEHYLERVTQCNELQQVVRDELDKNNISVVDVHGRAKRLYSLYLKLQRYNSDINRIYDLVALRVVVPTTEECYQALGIIHRRWKPLIGKIKDYVATPKANGYQSLHTTVIIDDGTFLEIQIRTPAMHDQAEYGVAAKWFYQETKQQATPQEISQAIANQQSVSWIKQLANWQKEVDNPDEFFETLKTDFFQHRIYCLTPAGEIINLPEGATPVDFAYAVHTELGNSCVSVKVNGQVKPLDYKLTSGDLVEIITKDKSAPKREWLDFAKTNTAKKNIKQWYSRLDRESAIQVGKFLIDKELQQLLNKPLKAREINKLKEFVKVQAYSSLDELYGAIGRGIRNPHQIVKRVFTEELMGSTWLPKRYPLNVKATDYNAGALRRARCCRPIEGDKITGIPQKERLIIHREECKNVIDAPKKITVEWFVEPQRSYRVWVSAISEPYIGMLRDITNTCSINNIAINDVSLRKLKNDQSQINILVEIKNTDQLSDLIRKLRTLPRIERVVRKKGLN